MEDNKERNLAQLLMLQKLLQNSSPESLNEIQKVAQEYSKQAGIKSPKLDKTIKHNPEVSKKVAKAFEEMKHAPDDPKVKKAYEALAKEVQDQYETMMKQGMNITEITPDMENPYKNSKELIKDITENKHMYYFPSDQGFGSGDKLSKNPMMNPSRFKSPSGKTMPVNDVFRVVHDYFGHGKDKTTFGPTGEERAYLAHKEMLSPEAQKALATETRGQNSWVNYGPHGEANRANPAKTIYAEQKTGLLPEWATKEVGEIKSPVKYNTMKALKMLGKSALPALAGASLLSSDDAAAGVADLVVPGGISGAGESSEEEDQMIAEQKAQMDYLKSQARQDALKKLSGN